MRITICLLVASLLALLSHAQSPGLEVEGQSVLFRGAEGQTPTAGAGVRLMWVPQLKAFRAGQVVSTEWDASNIGEWSSVLGGFSNRASGPTSTALGGQINHALERASLVAGGEDNHTLGWYSFTGGGLGLRARSAGEAVFGFYNRSLNPSCSTCINVNDKLLVVGNGVGNLNRRDAFSVWKNGNTNIGDVFSAPSERLTINDGRLFFDGTVPESNKWGVIEPTLAGIRVGGSWLPNIDGTWYDLGSVFMRWRSLYLSGSVVVLSDQSTKTNIANLEYGLDQVMNLRPVSFLWADRPYEGTQLGFISQEVQPFLPELIATETWTPDTNNNPMSSPNETLGMHYLQLIPVLTKAIQELADQNVALRQQNEKLELKVTEMEKLQLQMAQVRQMLQID